MNHDTAAHRLMTRPSDHLGLTAFRHLAGIGAILALLVIVLPAMAQSLSNAPDGELVSEGWRGFTDVAFLAHILLTLTVATLLGAVIAYHPRSRQTVDSIEDLEAPKIYLTYSVIGAIIGVMVLEFGIVVGFVVFGIGGLIRFRTDAGSATLTGRLIFVTLVGLSCGLNLPHLAVFATAFGFGLIYVLDAKTTYRIEIKDLDDEALAEAAGLYTHMLSANGCKVITTRRNYSKNEVTIVFRAPQRLTREVLENVIEREVPRSMRTAIDWQVS